MKEEVEIYRRCLLRQQLGHGADAPWGKAFFRGRTGQRGFGFFRLLWSKLLLPVVKVVGGHLIKRVIQGGKDVVLDNQPPKRVLRRRGKELLTDILDSASKQIGKGKRKRKLEEYGGPIKRARKSR